jgi:PmbA protein
VIFEAPLASGLIGSFVHAVSGGALYRKTSFLVDSLGKTDLSQLRAASANVRICEEASRHPLSMTTALPRVIARWWRVACYRAISFRLLRAQAGDGNHRAMPAAPITCWCNPARHDLTGLLREMGSGLLVTELLGQGVNYVTGDYSRGAAGYWVENGEIAYPVEEITIAGNLREMLLGIVDIGNDVEVRGSKQVGSILVERMTIAGN